MKKPSLITISLLYDLILDVKEEIEQLKQRDFNNNFRIYSMNEVAKLERKSTETIKREIREGTRDYFKHKIRKVKRKDNTVELHDVYTFLGIHLQAYQKNDSDKEPAIHIESTPDIVRAIIAKHMDN